MRIFFMALILLSNFGSTFTWPEGNKNSTVFDMSLSCANNYQKSVFLPYSMGVSDSVTFVVSNKYHNRNCCIIFHDSVFEANIAKIVVVEFVNKINNLDSVCKGSNIYLTENGEFRQNATVDLCSVFATSYFVNPFIFSTQVGVKIEIIDKSRIPFQIVKITGTTSRKISKDSFCRKSNETICRWDNNYACISKELMCDGINNCGQKGLYDEDSIRCRRLVRSELCYMIFIGVGILLYILVYTGYQIHKIHPKIVKKLRSSRARRKDAMTFTPHRSPVKTYIPVKAVDTLHLRVVSAPSFKLSEADVANTRYRLRKTSLRQ